MGHIAKITAKVPLLNPEGWNMEKEQLNLPFTVELKENFHLHWQDVRIEMMSDDFDNFVEALTEARKKWIKDGKPKELPEVKRYGWWPGEEEYDFNKDREIKYNKNSELCHHYKIFPRSESGKLNFDSVFQIEFQVNGQYHIHYKNFRIELGRNRFNEMAKAMKKSSDSVEKFGKIFHEYGKKKKKFRVLSNKFRSKLNSN